MRSFYMALYVCGNQQLDKTGAKSKRKWKTQDGGHVVLYLLVSQTNSNEIPTANSCESKTTRVVVDSLLCNRN